MTLIDHLGLLAVPLLLSVGQFLFKRAATELTTGSMSGFIGSVLGSAWFWLAMLIYGAATLLWLYVLHRVPLSRAMPFVALTFVLVPILAAVFLGERPSLTYWFGVAAILAGVLLITVPESG